MNRLILSTKNKAQNNAYGISSHAIRYLISASVFIYEWDMASSNYGILKVMGSVNFTRAGSPRRLAGTQLGILRTTRFASSSNRS